MNISSCVINNGFSTPSFNVKRGVREGDPLSPSLFITIVLELLALSMHNNDQIKGIAVDGSEIKLVIFADDMTALVRNKLSHRNLFETIDLGPVVRRLDNAIHRINHYPADKC